jgi:hypothetical protein
VVKGMVVKEKIKSALILFIVFVCIGCQGKIGVNQDGADLMRFSSLPIINDYLSQKVADKGFGGKAYCVYEVLDVEKSGIGESLYLWAVCQEYDRKGQKLEEGTGGSFPVALKIRQADDKVEVLSHQKPRDASYYGSDLKAMFSQKAFASANSMNSDRVSKLQNAVKQEAKIP